MIMTHHARFARSFARTVPTPEANKSLSIGMFRFGAVRCGSVRFARAVGVCRRARRFPQNSHNSRYEYSRRARRVREKCARSN